MTAPLNDFDDRDTERAPYLRRLGLVKEYDESKHPRDDHGRWVDAGGGSDIDREAAWLRGMPSGGGLAERDAWVAAKVRDFLAGKAQANYDNAERANWQYRSPEEFVLKHGEPMHAMSKPDWPPEVEQGRTGHCFQNAMELASQYPDKFTYCEGYAAGPKDPEGRVWAHAWVEAKDGRIIDNTWTHPLINEDMPRVQYFGVRFPIRYVLDHVLESRYVGVISSPNGHPLLENGLDYVKNYTPAAQRPRRGAEITSD